MTGSLDIYTISGPEIEMRHATLLLVGLWALAPGVAAQDSLKIEPGERVRLTLGSGRTTVGVLVTQDRDSLRIRPRPDAPAVAFSRSGIAGVEASLGRHGHAGTGALVGLVTGGTAGAALGGSCSGDFLCPGAGGGALLLGGTGLLFGALVGVFVRSERWEQVYENPVQVGFTRPPRGLGVRLSIRL